MSRLPHVHILDTGEGDWGAYPDTATAKRAINTIIADCNEYLEVPLTPEELTIIPSEEWCGPDPEPCEYERNTLLRQAMRQTPLWVHDYPPLPAPVYRIDGKRVARWKLACSMSIDKAMELWPFAGHPVALPHWEYNVIQADRELCPCTGRGHRRKGCIIGPEGKACHICGALFTDYGNAMTYCRPCADWRERREIYLADWAADQSSNPALATQPTLF